MATSFTSRERQDNWLLVLRWVLLAALLITEVIGLSTRFDTQSLSASNAWWTKLAGDMPALIRIVLAFVGAFLLLLSPRLDLVAADVQRLSISYSWRRWLLLHLIVFSAFYRVSLVIFASADSGGQVLDSLLAIWVLLGGLSFFLWLTTIAPTRFWFNLLSRERLPIAVAVCSGTIAWLGGLLAQQFWKPLAKGTFQIAYTLLSLIYPDTFYDSTDYVLGTSTFLVRIAPQCSGYEGIALITVFLALYLWLFRSEILFPYALLLFPIGILVIWLVNALRITLLITIGTSFSREVALGGFHSQAGWLGFIATALGLIVVMRYTRLFAITSTNTVVASESNSIASALLLPMLVLISSIMLTSAFSSGFDRLYPLRIVTTAATIWYFRKIYLHWEWIPSWQAVALGVGVFVIWLLLEPTASNNGIGQFLALLSPSEATIWISFRVIGSVFVVPIAEELAFRGYLIRRLAGDELENSYPPRFSWLALVLSSVAFGLLHDRWLAGTLAGMVYGLAFYRRGELVDAVVAHMTTNGLIAIFVLAYGEWALWS